ncbi:MAG: sugar kinase [Saprospiraceae bacterium]|nr:sugar kinase [Saprospiraceae bacterium]
MSLLTIGTVAFDTIETPFGKAERIVGGACTYISITASYLTKNINLCAVVGDDFPKSEMDYLISRGVNLDGLEIKAGEKSFFWHGRYHKDMNGRDTLETQLNVLGAFNPILPENYKNSEYVMLGNLQPSVQLSVLKQMTTRPKLVVLDTMNFWMDVALEELREVLKHIDVLTINDEEARQLSGEHSLRKAATKILTMGTKYLIIKKGEHGAMLFHEKDVFFCPALPLEEVFDPTGAGDTFAGGFIGYVAGAGDTSFSTLKKAIVYGSALASFCVEQFGIEALKNLTNEQIDERVREFGRMVHVNM